MKQFILSLALALASIAAFAQPAIGKIVYYEGKVELGSGQSWTAAKINMDVKSGQSIRTVGDAMAEITWTNGVKSVMGPNSTVLSDALMTGSAGKAKTETAGVFTGFKSKVSTSAKRSEEGGIRREQADGGQKEGDQVYWKQDKEILFSEAYAFYEAAEYGKAIAALQAFINQKPKDEMTPYALFALGHSYIMSNNPVKAKEIFSQFVTQYPGDSLRADAELIISKL